jgi:catechol 2,3-dioxygenase-like lactoylglutathione lyase family enzyme
VNERSNQAAAWPRAVNHIGVTVPDIFAAIDWYRDVLGLTHIMGPRVLEPASQATHETPSVFGARFRKAYQAHMLAANGVGLELFEFVEPAVERRPDNFEYWKVGVFHWCVTDPDVAGLAARIVAAGGRQRTDVCAFLPGRPYLLAYCEDPWGNIVEVFSHSYAEVFANWPQPGMTAPKMVTREQAAAERRSRGAARA